MSHADYLETEGRTEEEFDEDLLKRVRDAMAAQFILDDIANAEQMGVDEGELTQHLLMRAKQSGESPEEFIKHVMEHNHVPEFVAEVRRGKALAHVVESATVKDKSGAVVELATLKPDGSYADPEEIAAAEAAAQAEYDAAVQAEAKAADDAVAEKTDAANLVATTDYLDE